MKNKLFEIKNLKTYFYTEAGTVKAVNNVSFDIYNGEVLGIVGESGSGKSVTSLSINRLIPNPPGEIISGEILYFYRNRKKGAQTKYGLMKKGDLFFTPNMQEHMAYFTKNTHFLAFSTRKRTKFDYEKDLIRIDMRDYKIVKTAIKKFK